MRRSPRASPAKVGPGPARPPTSPARPRSPPQPLSVSLEFDKFLEERAKVADRLPSLSSPSAEGPPGPRPGATRKQTQEKDDDMLFAL